MANAIFKLLIQERHKYFDNKVCCDANLYICIIDICPQEVPPCTTKTTVFFMFLLSLLLHMFAVPCGP